MYIIDDSQLVENGGTFLVSGRRAVAITTDGSITTQWLTAAQGVVPDGADVASQNDVTNAQIAAQDYAVMLVDDLSGVTDDIGATAIGHIGLGGMQLAPFRNQTETIIVNPYVTGVVPLTYIGERLYGTLAIGKLYYSDDDGTTWVLVQETGTVGGFRSIWARPDGEVILHGSGNIWVSSGWATNPATATWTSKLTPTGTANFLFWAIDVYESRVIVSEYAMPRDDSKKVWISTDAGDTFTESLNLDILYPGQAANYHWHGVCYDPWANRFWATFGDATGGAYYSDDDGANWTLLSSPAADIFFTTACASEHGVVFGSDSATRQGLWTVKRIGTMAFTQIYHLRTVQTTFGFATVSRRNPRNNHVYTVIRSSFAGYPGYMLGSPDGLIGSELHKTTAQTVWNMLSVNGSGTKITGWYTDRGALVYTRFSSSVPEYGINTEIYDSGNLSGGVSTQNGVAVGVQSTAGNRGVANGSAAVAGDRSVAVGMQSNAADLAASVGRAANAANTYSTAVGDSASVTASYGTSIGQGASVTALNGTSLGQGTLCAYQRSVALGKGTTAQAADQVAVGERDVEIQDAARGVILRDTNGVRYRITVSTAGALVVTAL